MASNFNTEIESILVALKGSRWAMDATVITVIEEYGRLVDASKRLRHRERKPALQILFSCRAIDTLLKFAVKRFHPHLNPVTVDDMSIGTTINHITRLIDPLTKQDLEEHVRDKRNDYLHTAGIFPSDAEIELFLLATAIGIDDIARNLL